MEDGDRRCLMDLRESLNARWNAERRPATMHAYGLRAALRRDSSASVFPDSLIAICVFSEAHLADSEVAELGAKCQEVGHRVKARGCKSVAGVRA